MFASLENEALSKWGLSLAPIESGIKEMTAIENGIKELTAIENGITNEMAELPSFESVPIYLKVNRYTFRGSNPCFQFCLQSQ